MAEPRLRRSMLMTPGNRPDRMFSPTAAEVERAERLVAGYRKALAEGHGTALADGVFVAIDLLIPAERLLQRAALVRARDAASSNPPARA
ncbi:MAG: hypothetical protein ACYC0T_17550 [Ramlibacter sp.]